MTDIKGQVTFDQVSFGYWPDQTIINDFTAQARPGKKIAIVGPTGAGKTTIVNLLMKFYEINQGTIAIDGVDLAQMKRSEVHDAFAMVLQDTWLFEETIKENLISCARSTMFAKPKASARSSFPRWWTAKCSKSSAPVATAC